MGSLQGDINGSEIQGFAPIAITTTTVGANDISDYVAFRVSSDVGYDLGGTVATLFAGSITVCTHLSTINFDTAVVIEYM